MPRWLVAALFVVLGVILGSLEPGAKPNSQAEAPQLPPAKKIRINGADLAYVEMGRGEPVVLIHGFLLDYRSWVTQMDALAKRYRVIAYSQRFRYPNGPAPESADTRLAADIADLAGLIKKLKLGRAHIVGHSRGSNVAILFARKHPELVRSLILGEGPPPRSAGEDAASVAASRPSFRAEALQAYQRGDVDGALQIFSDGVLGPQHAPLPPIVGEMARSNAWQFRTLESPDQSETPFTCEDAGRLKVPVVYLQGEWSPPRARANGEQWKKCLPGSEHIVVPQSSHGLQFENPAAFNEIVLGFLARHSRLARR